jgi:hypothetical protein
MSVNRTEILDRLFANAEQFMAEMIEKQGTFTNLLLLRKVAQDQQEAYIDLLNSFRDTQNRSPFNAAHQEIGKRIYSNAIKVGYHRAEDLDRMGTDIFGNPTEEKFYRQTGS